MSNDTESEVIVVCGSGVTGSGMDNKVCRELFDD